MIQELQEFWIQYKKQIAEEANVLLNKSMPAITEMLYEIFEETGSRMEFEEVYFGRRRFLAVFGLEALVEEQETGTVSQRTLQKLTEVIEETCREECWAIAAHINRNDANWRRTVDLFAAETAQTMAELADRLQKFLPKELHAKMVNNVENRVLEPFFSTEVGQYGWENADHNWNAVILGSIGSASLHLKREQPKELEQCVERVCNSLSYYVDGFAEDGTCMEGLSYFTYGMTYFVNFAQELYAYTKGTKDLLCGAWGTFKEENQDKRERMASFQSKCYFRDGRTISFSDGSSHDKFRVGLSCVLAGRFAQVKMPPMKQAAGLLDDTCYRFAALKMDLFEIPNYIELLTESGRKENKVDAESRFQVLPDAQWCIAESENGVGMACKGGHNGEPHNHNDTGSFLYESKGVFFLTDLGAGEYTKEYFGENRYDILCNNSYGHNLPIVAGQGQKAEDDYRCTAFWTGTQKKESQVCMELAKTYPHELLQSFQRKLNFSLETGCLKVQDHFSFFQGKEDKCFENLVTQVKPEVQGNQIIITQNGASAVITIADVQETSQIVVRAATHSNHSAQTEPFYMIQWQVPQDGHSTFQINIQNTTESKHK